MVRENPIPVSPWVGAAVSIIVLSASCCSTALGIVVRDDVGPEQFLADETDYPYVVALGGAAGTLVSPDFVLTAAHVAKYMSRGRKVSGADGITRSVKEIYLYPSEGLFQPGVWNHDIALVQLNEAIDLSQYPLLYDGAEELGQEVVFLGRGSSGDGAVGITADDGLLRQASNRVIEVTATELVFQFDAPPEALPLEGISGEGDSGGPALLIQDGVLQERVLLVGVSSTQDPMGYDEGHYGVQERYVRVSTHLEWIEQVLNGTQDERNALAYHHKPCDGNPIDITDPSIYAGQYALGQGRTIEVIAQGHQLFKLAPRHELIYCGDDRFSYATLDISILFQRGINGTVNGLHYHQFYPIPATKLNQRNGEQ